MDQFQLTIGPIEAYDLIKLFDFTSGGRGRLGVFGVIWGQNSNIFKPRQFIYQNEALGHVITNKLFSRSPDPKLRGIWGHLGSKFKHFKTWTINISK